MQAIEELKPTLKTPFPRNNQYWKDPVTGLIVPKWEQENIEYRRRLLAEAEDDKILQTDLLAACGESFLYFINSFCWTSHQFDVDPDTGERIEARQPHNPFITWDIQDEMCKIFEEHLRLGKDILVDKCRDMGASWICIIFMHWLWLFDKKNAQLLEMSRTQDYVDQTGNEKALFQKHDYLNNWLPEWMLPPATLFGQKNRTKMHMKNVLNGNCIDGESTTEHAGSGDRRKVVLLDEFAKVEHGRLMRSATRDVALMRIINSTPAGPGTEYANWKQSGQIRVFSLPFYEHPEKGANRYVAKKEDGSYEIRSPWFDQEEKVRSPKEMAREILMQDLESGETFFTLPNIVKHISLFGKEPITRMHVHLKMGTANDRLPEIIRRRRYQSIVVTGGNKGPLRVWTQLIMGRPDQSKSYVFGIDIGKGQGASNSVISIKCIETGEKIAEWRDANTPPYDMARIAVALAIWCGGKKPHSLPFLIWENNGPGWDFGRQVVKIFHYPFFYRKIAPGKMSEKVTDKYGWQASGDSKQLLLGEYDRVMAHGGYINHCVWALEEMKLYIHYSNGGIGPACMLEENTSARKTHGDCVIADALTLLKTSNKKVRHEKSEPPTNSCGHRYNEAMKRKASKDKRDKSWRSVYDLDK